MAMARRTEWCKIKIVLATCAQWQVVFGGSLFGQQNFLLINLMLVGCNKAQFKLNLSQDGISFLASCEPR